MQPSREPENPEIQPADPGARKRALWTLFAILVLTGTAAIAFHFYGGRVERWAQDQLLELANRPQILFLLAFVLMIPLAGASIPVFRQASKIVKSERIPPPGAKVLKDTPVITGKKAIRQGRGLQIMAVLMALFGLLVPFGVAIILMLLQKGT